MISKRKTCCEDLVLDVVHDYFMNTHMRKDLGCREWNYGEHSAG